MSTTKKEKENTRQKKMAFKIMISLFSGDWHAFAFMTVLVISKNTQDVDFFFIWRQFWQKVSLIKHPDYKSCMLHKALQKALFGK